jgi:hypothetical protein
MTRVEDRSWKSVFVKIGFATFIGLCIGIVTEPIIFTILEFVQVLTEHQNVGLASTVSKFMFGYTFARVYDTMRIYRNPQIN